MVSDMEAREGGRRLGRNGQIDRRAVGLESRDSAATDHADADEADAQQGQRGRSRNFGDIAEGLEHHVGVPLLQQDGGGGGGQNIEASIGQICRQLDLLAVDQEGEALVVEGKGVDVGGDARIGLGIAITYHPTPSVPPALYKVETYFSPNGGCQDAVVSEINKAQKTIDLAMYDLTNRQISQELIKAKEKAFKDSVQNYKNAVHHV